MQPREILDRAGSDRLAPGNGKDRLYKIAIDLRGARRREVGLDPAGEPRVSYTLPLSGAVDDRWRRAFRLVQIEETGYFRFRLELASPAISFTCRESRSAAELSEGIRQLTVLVDRVNAMAARSAY
ncbi:MAG: hypothetical protein ABR576_03600 [Thermoanaerobaculia bacterium]